MLIRRSMLLSPGDQSGSNPPPNDTPPGDGDGGGDGDGDGGSANTPPKGNGSNGEGQIDQLPDWASKVVKDLRKENASYRTKAKQLEDRLSKFEEGFKSMFGPGEPDNTPPEEKLGQLTGQLEAALMHNAMLGAALEHGVPADSLEYFQFLLGKRLDTLKEGEDLSQEDVAALATEARGRSANLPGGGNGTTSVTPDSAPGKGASGETTLDQFRNMTIDQRTDLYRKNPAKYGELMQQLKSNMRRR